jgi:hypothetical protein
MARIPPHLPPYLGSVVCLAILVHIAPSGDPLRLGALAALVALQAWLAGMMAERWWGRRRQ